MIDPLTTLQGAYQIAKNMPWRLILELLGVVMIILLIMMLKNSWQDTGKWKEKAEALDLQLDAATLVIEQQDKSQKVTDAIVTSADVEKEKRDKRVGSLLKQLQDAKKAVCPKTERGNGNETTQTIPAADGIPHLKRVLDDASCEARAKADCPSTNTTP